MTDSGASCFTLLLEALVLVVATVCFVALVTAANIAFWAHGYDPVRYEAASSALDALMLPSLLCLTPAYFVLSRREKRSEASRAVPATEQPSMSIQRVSKGEQT